MASIAAHNEGRPDCNCFTAVVQVSFCEVSVLFRRDKFSLVLNPPIFPSQFLSQKFSVTFCGAIATKGYGLSSGVN